MRLKARSIEEKPKNRTDIDTEKYEPGVTSFELYSVTEASRTVLPRQTGR